MPKVIIPSGSGEILFVTNQSASLDFRRNAGIRSGSGIIGKWEVDPDDETSVQFRIPKEKIGTSNDRIAFYISGSGKIGIGTKDPETAFDVRDNTEDADPSDKSAKTKILKVDKTTQTFDTPVTASIVSASGDIITKVIYGKTGLDFKVNTGKTFDFLKAPLTPAVSIHAEGHITASGNISGSNTTNLIIGGNFIGSNVGPIYDNYIYLVPTDFDHQVDKVGVTVAGEIEGNGGYIADNNARAGYHAQKIIPKGYQVTHVMVKGSSASDEFRVYSSSYDVNTAATADGGAGNINTEKTLATKIQGGNGIYCSILWSSRGNTDVYGGYIKLEKQ